MKKRKYSSFISSISKLNRKKNSKYKSSKINTLWFYINNVIFIYISFVSIIIISSANNNLIILKTFTNRIYSIFKNFLIKNHENLNKKKLKGFLRLLPCKHSLLQPINITYVDFWPTFKPNRFYFQRLFEKNYQINVVDNIVGNISCYLIYSLFGSRHYNKKYKKCVKIYYTGENKVPDFTDSDFSIGFSHIKRTDRYIRVPLYLLRNSIRKINKTISMKQREKFCAWVTSKGFYKFRTKFFLELNKYKKVDSGGNYLNNINKRVNDKILFISDYKFSIQMENSATPGYCTEKLFEGFRAGTIPIYHGDESIKTIVNPKSFIFVKDESDFNYTISLIKDLDNNDEKYNKMINQKVILDDDYLRDEENKINKFFYEIFLKNKKYTNIFNGFLFF